MSHRRTAMWIAITAAVIAGLAGAAQSQAASSEPWQVSQRLDSALFDAQLGATLDEPAATRAALARATIEANQFAAALAPVAPVQAARLRAAVDGLAGAAGNEASLGVAVARVQAATLAGSFAATLAETRKGNAAQAERWLLVRGFETVTRYSHPDGNATVAVRSLRDGVVSKTRATRIVQVDLLDTYESLMRAALDDTALNAPHGLTAKTAQLAAEAEGYWTIVRPAYVAQRGAPAARELDRTLAALVTAALASKPEATVAKTREARADLLAFRAAPLAKAEQARRAGQLTRFLGLVPIEYARGVAGGTVTVPIEIQEAITFRDGAAGAFGDLQSYLARTNPELTRRTQTELDRLQTMLADAESGSAVADPDAIKKSAETALADLDALYPKAWRGDNAQADFDVIATLLQKVSSAAAAGDFRRAESSRLEAYATFELGPEQRLRGLAPGLFQRVEGLFWYGVDGHDGLAQLLRHNATAGQLDATLAELDTALKESAEAIGEGASAPTVIANTAIITFREGLEAVLILAALMASMVGPNRRYRRPLLGGALLALGASAVTWVIAQTVLRELSRYGEKLEAVVSLIAIGVLLLILNWFYHRIYWQENLQDLHKKKRSILSGAGMSLATAQIVGLVLLGFTSVYREGFETTLFVQALTLEAGALTVLQGIAIGLALTVAVGFLVMALERKLPHKKMLIATGLMITWVLVVLVGQTVQVLQKVGWIPLTPIEGFHPPYWSGVWLGVYPTWEGITAQIAAATFVIGSYFAAEGVRRHKRARILAAPISGTPLPVAEPATQPAEPVAERDLASV